MKLSHHGICRQRVGPRPSTQPKAQEQTSEGPVAASVVGSRSTNSTKKQQKTSQSSYTRNGRGCWIESGGQQITDSSFKVLNDSMQSLGKHSVGYHATLGSIHRRMATVFQEQGSLRYTYRTSSREHCKVTMLTASESYQILPDIQVTGVVRIQRGHEQSHFRVH